MILRNDVERLEWNRYIEQFQKRAKERSELEMRAQKGAFSSSSDPTRVMSVSQAAPRGVKRKVAEKTTKK